MRKKIIFRIFGLLLCSLLISCSAKSKITPEPKTLVNPYTLQVVDELYDGETLFLQLEIDELNKAEDKLCLLSLTGYNNNQEKFSKYYNLVDLQKDKNNQLTLALPVKDLADYQVQLYWGKQATELYRTIYPELSQKLLILNGHVDKLRDCQQDSCQIKFKLKFDLINKTELTIPQISLTISLLEKLDPLDQTALNELYAKPIPLPDFNIASGEVRQLEYIIVQPADLNELPTIAEVNISDKL